MGPPAEHQGERTPDLEALLLRQRQQLLSGLVGPIDIAPVVVQQQTGSERVGLAGMMLQLARQGDRRVDQRRCPVRIAEHPEAAAEHHPQRRRRRELEGEHDGPLGLEVELVQSLFGVVPRMGKLAPVEMAVADRMAGRDLKHRRVGARGQSEYLLGRLQCLSQLTAQEVVGPEPPERSVQPLEVVERLAQVASPSAALLDLEGSPALDRHIGRREADLQLELLPLGLRGSRQHT